MRRRDLERRLQSLGEPAPPPSDELVEHVAARLRMQGPPRRPERRTVFRPVVVLAAATAAILVLIVLVVPPAEPPLGSVTLAGSVDSTVELPDGTLIDAAAGTVVPEGSVVRTGPAGRVQADGVDLGPNSEARVSGGRLLVAFPPTEADYPSPPADRPDPTTRPTARSTAAPALPRPTAAAAPRPTPAPTRPPAELHLRCEPDAPAAVRADSRAAVTCTWPASRDARFASYELWRSDGDDRIAVFRTGEREHTRFSDMRVRSGRTYTYVVRALDARGSIIASGGPARVEAP